MPNDALPLEAWHAHDVDDVVATLSTSPDGLASADAEARRHAHGANVLPSGSHTPWWRILLRQFTDTLIAILLVAAVVSAATGQGEDALAIVAIVALNGLLGFVQEVRSERAMAALAAMLQPHARVRRGGAVRDVDAADLVPGDVVLLAVGDRVPADLRMVAARQLQIDESTLTGESEAVDKHTDRQAVDTPLAERACMAWMGTAVTHGHGEGVVVATGMATELGRVAALTGQVDATPTPLQRRLARLGRQLGAVSVTTAALVAAVGWLSGKPPMEMFLLGIALAVAVVPEGLPAVVTITLVLGIRQMLARRALIRRLQAAETLGCATIICSDKTGTLTENELTVTDLWIADGPRTLTGTGYAPEGHLVREGAAVEVDAGVAALLRTAHTCNHAHLERGEDGAWRVLGTPTEGALLVAAAKLGLDGPRPMVRAEHAFDADRKRMTVVVDGDAGPVVHTKGAPEHLLPRCAALRQDGIDRPLDAGGRRAVLAQVDAFGDRGLRVLALATRVLPAGVDLDDTDAVETDLVLLGLAAMHDPPRAAVPDALRTAAAAGVRTVMITGDAPGTALAIARQVGLVADRAITGPELDALPEEALGDLLDEAVVFARTTPEHKLRLVHALQARGHVVAMTGDGVNDAPALKAADIGVAMGQRGTEVARGAADMVLTDDNYASIVGAIEEGRRQYDNIVKFVRYLLTSNTGEVLALVGGLILGGPLLLLPVQILWMNLVTDGVTAVALGLEPPEPGVMRHAPRAADAPILDRGAAVQIGALGLYVAAVGVGLFAWTYDGTDLAYARTMAFTGLVIVEKLNVFGFRSLTSPLSHIGWTSNPWLLAAWASMVGLQVAAVYVPFLQAVLGTVPLSLADWALILAVSVPIVLVPELTKRWRARAR
ncbi:MAG: HAD-IC family P-type ATPase [Alphaproteobacteria bacterium]|nr:HAD-IC family P-type ATPase [Alphaproteobacteria bacterium]